jgi:hypothetical protein
MEIHFKIIGVLLIVLSFVHIIFPGYFKWKEELSSLSLINKQMMYVHTFFIALVVFLFGMLSLTCAAELVSTPLGKKISLGLGIFWVIRLFIQFFGYSAVLWRGKVLETGIHILFSMLWTYMSIVFLVNYFKEL